MSEPPKRRVEVHDAWLHVVVGPPTDVWDLGHRLPKDPGVEGGFVDRAVLAQVLSKAGGKRRPRVGPAAVEVYKKRLGAPTGCPLDVERSGRKGRCRRRTERGAQGLDVEGMTRIAVPVQKRGSSLTVMQDRDPELGVTTVCVGLGQGITNILQRLH